MGIDYHLAPGPSRPSKRDEIAKHTGQRFYPAIEFEDGTWYRDESKEMEKTIRDGRLGPFEVSDIDTLHAQLQKSPSR